MKYPRQQRKTEDKYRGSSLEFSRCHGTTKLRKKPHFIRHGNLWTATTLVTPTHCHLTVFIDVASSCWRNGRQNWEIRTFACARRVKGCSNLQHTTWLPYDIPRNSDLIRQHDYICSHGLNFVTHHYHSVADNLSRHFKSPSCYLEVTIEYVSIVLFCGNSRKDQLGTIITNGHLNLRLLEAREFWKFTCTLPEERPFVTYTECRRGKSELPAVVSYQTFT